MGKKSKITKTEKDFSLPKNALPIDYLMLELKKKELEYFLKLQPKVRVEREKKKKELLQYIDLKDDEEAFENFRKCAVSEGGFLTNELRAKVYKKIFCVNKKNFFSKYQTIWINHKNNSLFKLEEELYQPFTSSEMRVIDADVIRSYINFIFSSKTDSVSNLTMKYYLSIFINTLTSFNDSEFNYFQGYHNIGLLFLLVFLDALPEGIVTFQRFSEFILKESLLVQDPAGKKGFTFNNSLGVFNKILEKTNKDAFNLLKDHAESNPTFVVSWIISLFTQNVQNLFLQLRLLDYFLVSHPLAVFVLAAQIAADEINKMKGKKMVGNFLGNGNQEELNITDFFMHFQEIKFEKTNFDYYIEKTENFFKKNDISEIMEPFKKEGFESYYPIMNKELYVKKLEKEEKKGLIKVNNRKFTFYKNIFFLGLVPIGLMFLYNYNFWRH